MAEKLIFSIDVVPEVVAAGAAAAAKVNHPQFAIASEVLFLAWRQAFLDEWADYEKRMNPAAVKIAKKMAGDQCDRIVFKQPLAYQRDVAGREWQVRDLVYSSTPFWFAAYYEVVRSAIEDA